MIRQKLIKLDEALDIKIQKAKEYAEKTNESANEVAKTAAGSWSAAGDREHARGHAEITQKNLVELQKLDEEIRNSLNTCLSGTVEPVCFVELAFDDGREEELYFVNNTIFLSGFNLVSANSPLGLVLFHKKTGDKVKFRESSFEIISIE